MKKQLFVLLAMMSLCTLASAAEFTTCLNDVETMCKNGVTTQANIIRLLSEDQPLLGKKACKIVQAGNYETNETSYGKKVALFDRNTLIAVRQDLSVDLLGYVHETGKCTMTLANLNSDIRDNAVYEGRLFAITGDHKVIAVARTGKIVEMLTRDGESYKRVNGVRVEGNTLTLTQERGADINLSLNSIGDRLNDKDTTRCLAGCN